LEFNFNKPGAGIGDPGSGIGDRGSGGSGTATSDRPESAANVRFRSCRWMQPAENGNTEFCTHREVKPYAGTTGFDPDAWCQDCQYYKLRRSPKKRSPNDDYPY